MEEKKVEGKKKKKDKIELLEARRLRLRLKMHFLPEVFCVGKVLIRSFTYL